MSSVHRPRTLPSRDAQDGDPGPAMTASTDRSRSLCPDVDEHDETRTVHRPQSGREGALVLVRKLGVPGQEELALGAVVDGPASRLFVNEGIRQAVGTSDEEIERISARELRSSSGDARSTSAGANRSSWPARRRSSLIFGGCANGCRVVASVRAGVEDPRAVPVGHRSVSGTRIVDIAGDERVSRRGATASGHARSR